MTTSRLLLPARPRGQWFGWGISLLVHAGVLAWLLHALPALPPSAKNDPAPVPRMRFVLVPTRPHTAPAPAASPSREHPAAAVSHSRPVPSSSATVATAPAPAPRPQAAAAQSAPTPVITSDDPTPAAPAPTGAAEPGTEAAAADADAGPPGFDMNEARKTARLIAKHRKDGLVALPKAEPPLERDDRLGRAIERARRPDCKSAYSGLGLLAVIPLAKDAVTGSGCKW